MKSLKLLPLKERRHFMKCECGEYFNMRDLNQLMKHLHKTGNKAAAPEKALKNKP